MRIVIEGCDGVGKTSVCKLLAEHYGFDLVHFTGDDPKDNLFYYETLRKNNVVYDRHYVGELIYPKIFNRKSSLTINNVKEGIKAVDDAYFFVLTADTNVIRERITKRGEEHKEIVDQIDYIDCEFVSIAQKLDIPIIDTTFSTPEKTANIIINLINGGK